MPVPSAVQLEPYHFAIRLAGTPAAKTKVPPTKSAGPPPSSNTARARTELSVPVHPNVGTQPGWQLPWARKRGPTGPSEEIVERLTLVLATRLLLPWATAVTWTASASIGTPASSR